MGWEPAKDGVDPEPKVSKHTPVKGGKEATYRFREGSPTARWDNVRSQMKECSENRGGENKGLG